MRLRGFFSACFLALAILSCACNHGYQKRTAQVDRFLQEPEIRRNFSPVDDAPENSDEAERLVREEGDSDDSDGGEKTRGDPDTDDDAEGDWDDKDEDAEAEGEDPDDDAGDDDDRNALDTLKNLHQGHVHATATHDVVTHRVKHRSKRWLGLVARLVVRVLPRVIKHAARRRRDCRRRRFWRRCRR